MTAPPDQINVARIVLDVFDRVAARYSVGGSMASAFAGEPRSTLDIDVVVELTGKQASTLADALDEQFYFDRDRLLHAIDAKTSANLIHSDTLLKIDLFIAGGTPLDEQILQRRRLVVAGTPPQAIYVHSPEDILLQKLRWFRLGGEVSDRQWRDVLAIVQVQRGALDDAYVASGARLFGVEDLLARARSETGD